jgi:O-antigen/teichoic acid export membrane protein
MAGKYELGQKMRTGALWIYLQGGLSSVIQFMAGIALARIMDPSDFGVFYAATAYTSLLLLQTQFGVPSSLIRAKELTDVQWNGAFWFMQGVAVLCVLVIVVFSGLLQNFYDDSRFAVIMMLLSITILLSPISSILGTRLRRNLDYKDVSKIQIIVGLIGIVVSISCALMGLGPYSLVIAGIASGLLSAVLLVRATSWHPGLPGNFEGLKSILSYGWRLHLNNSLNMGANKVDNMLVGSLSGVHSLGIYNRALSSARMPVTEITGRLYQLFFSGLSRIQDDMNHTILMYQKILCAMTNAVFPFLLAFFFLADGFIYTLYGEKWLAASEILKILALGSMPRVISITMGALADAQNLVSKETPIQLSNLVLTILAVVVGSYWGLTGIAIGISLKMAFQMFLMQRMLSRSHLGIRWRLVLEGTGPAIIGALVSSASTFALTLSIGTQLESTSIVYILFVGSFLFLSYGITLFAHSKLSPDNQALAASITMFKDMLLKAKTYFESKLNTT